MNTGYKHSDSRCETGSAASAGAGDRSEQHESPRRVSEHRLRQEDINETAGRQTQSADILDIDGARVRARESSGILNIDGTVGGRRDSAGAYDTDRTRVIAERGLEGTYGRDRTAVRELAQSPVIRGTPVRGRESEASKNTDGAAIRERESVAVHAIDGVRAEGGASSAQELDVEDNALLAERAMAAHVDMDGTATEERESAPVGADDGRSGGGERASARDDVPEEYRAEKREATAESGPLITDEELEDDHYEVHGFTTTAGNTENVAERKKMCRSCGRAAEEEKVTTYRAYDEDVTTKTELQVSDAEGEQHRRRRSTVQIFQKKEQECFCVTEVDYIPRYWTTDLVCCFTTRPQYILLIKRINSPVVTRQAAELATFLATELNFTVLVEPAAAEEMAKATSHAVPLKTWSLGSPGASGSDSNGYSTSPTVFPEREESTPSSVTTAAAGGTKNSSGMRRPPATQQQCQEAYNIHHNIATKMAECVCDISRDLSHTADAASSIRPPSSTSKHEVVTPDRRIQSDAAVPLSTAAAKHHSLIGAAATAIPPPTTDVAVPSAATAAGAVPPPGPPAAPPPGDTTTAAAAAAIPTTAAAAIPTTAAAAIPTTAAAAIPTTAAAIPTTAAAAIPTTAAAAIPTTAAAAIPTTAAAAIPTTAAAAIPTTAAAAIPTTAAAAIPTTAAAAIPTAGAGGGAAADSTGASKSEEEDIPRHSTVRYHRLAFPGERYSFHSEHGMSRSAHAVQVAARTSFLPREPLVIEDQEHLLPSAAAVAAATAPHVIPADLHIVSGDDISTHQQDSQSMRGYESILIASCGEGGQEEEEEKKRRGSSHIYCHSHMDIRGPRLFSVLGSPEEVLLSPLSAVTRHTATRERPPQDATKLPSSSSSSSHLKLQGTTTILPSSSSYQELQGGTSIPSSSSHQDLPGATSIPSSSSSFSSLPSDAINNDIHHRNRTGTGTHVLSTSASATNLSSTDSISTSSFSSLQQRENTVMTSQQPISTSTGESLSSTLRSSTPDDVTRTSRSSAASAGDVLNTCTSLPVVVAGDDVIGVSSTSPAATAAAADATEEAASRVAAAVVRTQLSAFPASPASSSATSLALSTSPVAVAYTSSPTNISHSSAATETATATRAAGATETAAQQKGSSRQVPAVLCDSIDLVVALGGDGTMLWVSQLFAESVPPVVGVAMGTLGYLTRFTMGAARRQLRAMAACKRFRVNLRCRLKVTLISKDGTPLETFVAFNECVIDRGPSSNLCTLDVYCNNSYFTSVAADGLILATPTGSTAYSMSAGGSMVHPKVPCLLFTPICPHSLSFRPVILPDSVELRIVAPEDSRGAVWIAVDGRSRTPVEKGMQVLVSLSAFPFPMVTRSNPSAEDIWLEALKKTLNWNCRIRQGEGPPHAVEADSSDSNTSNSSSSGSNASAKSFTMNSSHRRSSTGSSTFEEEEDSDDSDNDGSGHIFSSSGRRRHREGAKKDNNYGHSSNTTERRISHQHKKKGCSAFGSTSHRSDHPRTHRRTNKDAIEKHMNRGKKKEETNRSEITSGIRDEGTHKEDTEVHIFAGECISPMTRDPQVYTSEKHISMLKDTKDSIASTQNVSSFSSSSASSSSPLSSSSGVSRRVITGIPAVAGDADLSSVSDRAISSRIHPPGASQTYMPIHSGAGHSGEQQKAADIEKLNQCGISQGSKHVFVDDKGQPLSSGQFLKYTGANSATDVINTTQGIGLKGTGFRGRGQDMEEQWHHREQASEEESPSILAAPRSDVRAARNTKWGLQQQQQTPQPQQAQQQQHTTQQQQQEKQELQTQRQQPAQQQPHAQQQQEAKQEEQSEKYYQIPDIHTCPSVRESQDVERRVCKKNEEKDKMPEVERVVVDKIVGYEAVLTDIPGGERGRQMDFPVNSSCGSVTATTSSASPADAYNSGSRPNSSGPSAFTAREAPVASEALLPSQRQHIHDSKVESQADSHQEGDHGNQENTQCSCVPGVKPSNEQQLCWDCCNINPQSYSPRNAPEASRKINPPETSEMAREEDVSLCISRGAPAEHTLPADVLAGAGGTLRKAGGTASGLTITSTQKRSGGSRENFHISSLGSTDAASAGGGAAGEDIHRHCHLVTSTAGENMEMTNKTICNTKRTFETNSSEAETYNSAITNVHLNMQVCVPSAGATLQTRNLLSAQDLTDSRKRITDDDCHESYTLAASSPHSPRINASNQSLLVRKDHAIATVRDVVTAVQAPTTPLDTALLMARPSHAKITSSQNQQQTGTGHEEKASRDKEGDQRRVLAVLPQIPAATTSAPMSTIAAASTVGAACGAANSSAVDEMILGAILEHQRKCNAYTGPHLKDDHLQVKRSLKEREVNDVESCGRKTEGREEAEAPGIDGSGAPTLAPTNKYAPQGRGAEATRENAIPFRCILRSRRERSSREDSMASSPAEGNEEHTVASDLEGCVWRIGKRRINVDGEAATSAEGNVEHGGASNCERRASKGARRNKSIDVLNTLPAEGNAVHDATSDCERHLSCSRIKRLTKGQLLFRARQRRTRIPKGGALSHILKRRVTDCMPQRHHVTQPRPRTSTETTISLSRSPLSSLSCPAITAVEEIDHTRVAENGISTADARGCNNGSSIPYNSYGTCPTHALNQCVQIRTGNLGFTQGKEGKSASSVVAGDSRGDMTTLAVIDSVTLNRIQQNQAHAPEECVLTRTNVLRGWTKKVSREGEDGGTQKPAPLGRRSTLDYESRDNVRPEYEKRAEEDDKENGVSALACNSEANDIVSHQWPGALRGCHLDAEQTTDLQHEKNILLQQAQERRATQQEKRDTPQRNQEEICVEDGNRVHSTATAGLEQETDGTGTVSGILYAQENVAPQKTQQRQTEGGRGRLIRDKERVGKVLLEEERQLHCPARQCSCEIARAGSESPLGQYASTPVGPRQKYPQSSHSVDDREVSSLYLSTSDSPAKASQPAEVSLLPDYSAPQLQKDGREKSLISCRELALSTRAGAMDETLPVRRDMYCRVSGERGALTRHTRALSETSDWTSPPVGSPNTLPLRVVAIAAVAGTGVANRSATGPVLLKDMKSFSETNLRSSIVLPGRGVERQRGSFITSSSLRRQHSDHTATGESPAGSVLTQPLARQIPDERRNYLHAVRSMRENDVWNSGTNYGGRSSIAFHKRRNNKDGPASTEKRGEIRGRQQDAYDVEPSSTCRDGAGGKEVANGRGITAASRMSDVDQQDGRRDVTRTTCTRCSCSAAHTPEESRLHKNEPEGRREGAVFRSACGTAAAARQGPPSSSSLSRESDGSQRRRQTYESMVPVHLYFPPPPVSSLHAAVDKSPCSAEDSPASVTFPVPLLRKNNVIPAEHLHLASQGPQEPQATQRVVAEERGELRTYPQLADTSAAVAAIMPSSWSQQRVAAPQVTEASGLLRVSDCVVHRLHPAHSSSPAEQMLKTIQEEDLGDRPTGLRERDIQLRRLRTCQNNTPRQNSDCIATRKREAGNFHRCASSSATLVAKDTDNPAGDEGRRSMDACDQHRRSRTVSALRPSSSTSVLTHSSEGTRSLAQSSSVFMLPPDRCTAVVRPAYQPKVTVREERGGGGQPHAKMTLAPQMHTARHYRLVTTAEERR